MEVGFLQDFSPKIFKFKILLNNDFFGKRNLVNLNMNFLQSPCVI